MSIDDLDLPYDAAELREFVETAVAQGDEAGQPVFCAVGGSHRYGFTGPESDVDLRCVHVVPAAEYAYLQRPASEHTVNQDGVTAGFEEFADVELRSYELRKFGSLVHGGSPDVVELVFDAPTVLDEIPDEVAALRETIREFLPLNLPHAYRGLARSICDEHLDPDRDGGREPRAKQVLHAYRALLAARYVLEREDVEADVRALAETVGGGDPTLVDVLIERRRDAASARLGVDLASRARTAIEEQFDAVEELPEPEPTGYREAIDEWMRTVRS